MEQVLSNGFDRPLSTNILHLFSLTQYELPQLKEYCEKILVQFCTVQNALEIVEYAKLYNLVEATEEIKSYISE
jgi:hypothetical protein